MQRNQPPFAFAQRSDTDALAQKQFARFASDFHQDLIFQTLSRFGMSECLSTKSGHVVDRAVTDCDSEELNLKTCRQIGHELEL